jgi:hypothetical protein
MRAYITVQSFKSRACTWWRTLYFSPSPLCPSSGVLLFIPFVFSILPGLGNPRSSQRCWWRLKASRLRRPVAWNIVNDFLGKCGFHLKGQIIAYALKIEAEHSAETSVIIYESARRCIPEDLSLHCHVTLASGNQFPVSLPLVSCCVERVRYQHSGFVDGTLAMCRLHGGGKQRALAGNP